MIEEKWLECTERRARELRIRQLRLDLKRSATCTPGCTPRPTTRGGWCARCAPLGRRSPRVLLVVSRRETRAVNRHQFAGGDDEPLGTGQLCGRPSITVGAHAQSPTQLALRAAERAIRSAARRGFLAFSANSFGGGPLVVVCACHHLYWRDGTSARPQHARSRNRPLNATAWSRLHWS